MRLYTELCTELCTRFYIGKLYVRRPCKMLYVELYKTLDVGSVRRST